MQAEKILRKIFFGDDFGKIKTIVSATILKPDEEKQIIRVFQVLVWELQSYEDKPVIFLIDQCNVFHESPQMIKMYSNSRKKKVSPDENPVGVLFLD